MDKEIRSFTISNQGIVKVIKTGVEISQAFDPQKSLVNPLVKKFTAIWDTGATNTVISQRVIEECALETIGEALVHTAVATREEEVFSVNIILPNSLGIANMQVAAGIISGADVLIGMDVITQGDFALTNTDGRTVFSFRMPSVECIDFVT
jgi:hypothetical protein